MVDPDIHVSHVGEDCVRELVAGVAIASDFFQRQEIDDSGHLISHVQVFIERQNLSHNIFPHVHDGCTILVQTVIHGAVLGSEKEGVHHLEPCDDHSYAE